MTSENKLTPKKWIGKKKEGEIYRFQLFLAEKNIKPEQIQRDTGVTVRTITNSIYEGKPLGAKILRELHAKYGVSIDWLVSGTGEMMVQAAKSEAEHSAEPNATYKTGFNSDLERVLALVSQFMSMADEREQAWLETQIKFGINNIKDL